MTTFKGQLVLALVLNVGLKVVTFSLSTLLTRKLLPYQNGVYFTYNVYNDAVLFVAREATRNVASRLSILEESDEVAESRRAAAEPSTSDAEKKSSSSQIKKPSTEVDVANVRRMISMALCSVALAVVAALVLEVIGVCFGRFSMFPSMMRHARVSQQQQQQQQDLYTLPHGSESGGLKGTVERLPLLLFPYLPELTVMGCTVLMAFVEPCVVVVQSLNLFRVVVLAECATLTARMLTVLTIIYTTQRRGADALQVDGEPLNGNGLRTLWEARMTFAFGQLAYAVTHVLYYTVVVSGLPVARWLGASAELQQVRAACLEGCASPKKSSQKSEADAQNPSVPASPSFPFAASRLYGIFAFPWCFYSVSDSIDVCRQEAALFFTFLRESLLRLVLSEGESFALTSLGSESARGYYHLIYSLGSLVARLLFRVWENACFVKWSREASLGHQQAAVQLLKLMVRVSFYVGFSFALLGPPLTRTFLLTMYTSRWATPQVTVALQRCFYGMPIMAWNGLLEAFLRAVASPAVLQRLQRWMVGETVVYIAVCYATLMSFGKNDEQGDSVRVLVLLNVLNMLWRCGASIYLLVISPAASHVPTSSGAEATSAHPLVHLHEFAHVFSARILVSFLSLFILSRVVTASVASIACIGVAYGVVIFACDAEVRRLLILPVWSRVVLLRPRRSGDGGGVGTPREAVSAAEKKRK
ncbi:putative dolichyl-P-Man:GDP-Man5GlcNAc2-PP-dolichyl alpha-12-mannosyltranslocase [Leptomonas pyrrhocoris]|uniref:Protein RFT1 homolog n=1 Tax=Leptomonas pyrrhocoris TaxID=157538 RepID=A0A0M9G8Z4_LEPPY|nr:putative dolichyl-P-Man:GDP-Man5GlcNAc2-PP-dolichyl alpha-12-mannosyltranslocase [Leptomonas pyrrhocoris]KPA85167.1 putative dolichyl-P-Man:GDP-Man5GlcNAc2-PP-dolichyl alpha-12-mannosyltranslocase [Leptomonas pyrrhocoris]|eukprot:XP_015663606.1 putative dolichyl-P-Man:GDP-Man5GlcNAc2-PP-dolichyl alpha-12-mannosyltranslocase [Leptomonas pyrrhocoris]